MKLPCGSCGGNRLEARVRLVSPLPDTETQVSGPGGTSAGATGPSATRLARAVGSSPLLRTG